MEGNGEESKQKNRGEEKRKCVKVYPMFTLVK